MALTRCRAALLGVCALAAATPPAYAQDTETRGRPWVATVAQYAKWPALAGSAYLLVQAARDRDAAEDQRDALEQYCAGRPLGCSQSAAGTYLDPEAEAMARAADARDRRARNFMLGGEITLIAAGVGFVLDLVHDGDGQPNIPYTPFRVFTAGRRVGLGAAF